MSMNLKINNYMKHGKKTLIIPRTDNIFRLDIKDYISEISNFIAENDEQTKEETNDETKNETKEENEVKEENTCRICFEEEIDENNKLISPCLCRGTQKHIHMDCLNEWRIVNDHNPVKRDNCEICKFHFVIRNQINFLNYKEQTSFAEICLRHLFIIIVSSVYGTFDYGFDFFTVKVLNLFLLDKCEILTYFNNMKQQFNNDNIGNYDHVIILYIAFIFSFINFLVYLFLVIKILKNKINNIEYSIKVKNYNTFLKTQISLFLFFYYIGLIIDNFDFFSSLLPFICFINIISYNFYIIKTNIILDELHDNRGRDVIYSFENNPLLEIQTIQDNI